MHKVLKIPTQDLESIYTPKYVQIQNYIIGKIRSGEFDVGDKIPSETELAKMFEVSRITANTAVKELATRGIVDRIRGKGTYVLSSKSYEANGSMAFSRNLKIVPANDTLSTKKHLFLHQGVFTANSKVKSNLELQDDELVYRIVRLVEQDGKAIELDYSFIAMDVCKNHEFLQDEIEVKFLHNYMQEHMSFIPKYIKIFINTSITEDMDLSLLDIDDHTELFIWDTYICDDDKAVAFTTTISIPQTNKPFMTLIV